MKHPDLFSQQAQEYSQYRPEYPDTLFEYIATQVTDKQHAWDVGTGNGQIARGLTKHFSSITATDISQAQIDNAYKHKRITYSVTPAENSGLNDECIDLVVVGQALHWFNLDAFFAEVARVLKDKGTLCVVTYALPRINTDIDASLDQFHNQTLADYWPAERQLVDAQYDSIKLPWPEENSPVIDMCYEWQCEQLLAYIETWSAVTLYKKQNGTDPTVKLKQTLKKLWRNNETLTVSWPLTIKIARKNIAVSDGY